MFNPSVSKKNSTSAKTIDELLRELKKPPLFKKRSSIVHDLGDCVPSNVGDIKNFYDTILCVMNALKEIKDDDYYQTEPKLSSEIQTTYTMYARKFVDEFINTQDNNSQQQIPIDQLTNIIMQLGNLRLDLIGKEEIEKVIKYLRSIVSVPGPEVVLYNSLKLDKFINAIYALGNLIAQNREKLANARLRDDPEKTVQNVIIGKLIDIYTTTTTTTTTEQNPTNNSYDKNNGPIATAVIETFGNLVAKLAGDEQKRLIDAIKEYYKKNLNDDFAIVALAKVIVVKELREKLQTDDISKVLKSLFLTVGRSTGDISDLQNDNDKEQKRKNVKAASDILVKLIQDLSQMTQVINIGLDPLKKAITDFETITENAVNVDLSFNSDIRAYIKAFGELGSNLPDAQAFMIVDRLNYLMDLAKKNQSKILGDFNSIADDIRAAIGKLSAKRWHDNVFFILSAISGGLLFSSGVMCLKFGGLLFLASSFIPPAAGLVLISTAIFLAVYLCLEMWHVSTIKRVASTLSDSKGFTLKKPPHTTPNSKLLTYTGSQNSSSIQPVSNQSDPNSQPPLPQFN